jgi:hypothetical protein
LRKTTIRVSAIIGITLAAAAVSEARQPERPPDITVCLRTEVIAGPGEIERAKSIAKDMFGAIGINLAWRGETSGREQGIVINVELVSGNPGGDEEGALAEAYPFALEHDVTVRYDRVHNSVGGSRELEPILLGHVLAHEITHVLQCVDRHSETGVMKSHWTTDDYYGMRWKPLEFTTEDVELIRLGMRALQSRAGGHSTAAAAQMHGQ